MPLIATTDRLADLCDRLACHPFVTVDTEFMRETTYWPRLCVIQLASDEEAAAIDAMAPDLDLTPFFALMADERVTKVFHAARQDLEIIWNLSKQIPAPLFDTQVAAAVCGFGDQASYGDLARSFAKVTIDKSSRFTDWARRPLSQAQIDYAIADVTHLRTVYKALKTRLEKTSRLDWLADEMRTLTSPETYEMNPDNAWERFRGRVRKPRDVAMLMELAAWREREAQAKDVPRSRVLKDDALVEIALAAPMTQEALAGLRAFPRGMERSRAGADILAAMQRAAARDPQELPRIERERRNGGAGATVELLKVLLRQVCDGHGVAARMIATVDDLEAIAHSDKADVPALKGWRREIFGRRALEMKHGRLALTLERGKVVALEWQEEVEAEPPAAAAPTEDAVAPG
ncbi:MAG: ribonuclease D [Methylobacteriaceae bacterium]|nr:ribonuclease D [Methylobacteriaceae bacterium]